MLIAVYGNFRKGEPLSHCVDYLRVNGDTETVELSGMKMYIVGMAPGVKITHNEEDKVVVELIEAALSNDIESIAYRVLDKIEGVDIGLYKKELVDTHRGKAIIYVYCGPVEGCTPIVDWKVWVQKTVEEKLEAIQKAGDNAIVIR